MPEEAAHRRRTPPVGKCDFSKIEIPEVTDYSDLREIGYSNPVLAAMAVTRERSKRGWGHWVKVLNAARRKHGNSRADQMFMEAVEKAYGEIKAGEADRPGAILNQRLAERFESGSK